MPRNDLYADELVALESNLGGLERAEYAADYVRAADSNAEREGSQLLAPLAKARRSRLL